MTAGSMLNRKVSRINQAARQERLQSPAVAQSTKSARYSTGGSEVFWAVCQEDAPEREYFEARFGSGDQSWLTGTQYAAAGSGTTADAVSHFDETESPIDHIYTCLVSHTAGGDSVWSDSLSYTTGDRVSHSGTVWKANANTSAGEEPGVSGKWDEDNDEPGVGNAWQTYWQQGENIQVYCDIMQDVTDLSVCTPRLTRYKTLPVAKRGDTWYCLWWFYPDITCNCSL